MIQCFSTIKTLGENLAWLTQKTEEKKVIKQTLLFPHDLNFLDLFC